MGRDELPTLTLHSDSMSLSVLYRYSQYLASNGQPMEKYLSTFWQKLLMPLTVGAMVLLATPISANLGAGATAVSVSTWHRRDGGHPVLPGRTDYFRTGPTAAAEHTAGGRGPGSPGMHLRAVPAAPDALVSDCDD